VRPSNSVFDAAGAALALVTFLAMVVPPLNLRLCDGSAVGIVLVSFTAMDYVCYSSRTR
jgi:hypothetical protein